MARKCEIRSLNDNMCNIFCNTNHIQGRPPQIIYSCGLYHGSELVGAMSLGSDYQNFGQVILNRFCFSPAVRVSGGFGKMLNRCLEWCGGKDIAKIVTSTDRRWTEGAVYSTSGFALDDITSPEYSYVKGRYRFEREYLEGCPLDETELIWANERGWHRIWDCGRKIWSIEV